MSCRGAVRAAVTTVTFFEFGPKYNVGPSIDADEQQELHPVST